jgi:hypothetical protein
MLLTAQQGGEKINPYGKSDHRKKFSLLTNPYPCEERDNE